jgi:CshA-type fibril repeat protein
MLPAAHGTAVPRRPGIRRSGSRLLAMAGAALLVGGALTQAVTADPAAAATALSCDQNTLYAIDTANNQLASINATSGAVTNVVKLDPGNNALAVARNGVAAYASQNTGNTITGYDAVNGVRLADVTNADPAGAANRPALLRGAVNPATGLYYYATGGTGPVYLGAYNPKTGEKIGQVGRIGNLVDGKNGDMAFSSRGLLFVVTGNQIRRVDSETVPAVKGTDTLSTSLVATLPIDPSDAGSPGIAFSSDGYLYASVNTTMYKINPGSGKLETSYAIGNGNYLPSDLASCNYANTLTAQSSVDDRWSTSDQFALTISGGDVSSGNTATTDGTAPGVQAKHAGAVLTLPSKQYTATQTRAGSTDLADYDTTWKAVNVNADPTSADAVVASGTGNTATFTFPAAKSADGTDIVVTFANRLTLTHVTTASDTYATPVDTTLDVPAAGVLRNDTGTGLTVTKHTDPANGTLTMSATDGSFSYRPSAGFSGTDQFTYTATDGGGRPSTSTVTITVTPKATDDAFSVHTGSTATAKASAGVLANDHGTGLTVTGHTAPAHGDLTLGADGSYAYTPTAGWSGTDAFTYTAKDGTGATISATVSITVLPTATADTVAATAGTTTTVAAPGVLGNDLGTGLTVTGNTTPAHGSASVRPDGTVVYTPAAGWSGPDTFDYTVTDRAGTTDTVTVTVQVAPEAVDDTATVDAGSAVATSTRATGVLGNDVGTGLTITSSTKPANGIVQLDPGTGAYTYTPTPGFSGTDRFTYTATDSAGTTTSATVTITVRPTAAADTATTPAGRPVTIDVQGNDRGTGLTTALVGRPAHGTVAVAPDGSVQYTPAAGYSGPDSSTYTVTDAAGQTTQPATVAVSVTPVAQADTAATKAGQPLTIPAADLLGNDTGSSLRVTGATAANGTVSIAPDGTVVYTSAAGFSGTDTVTYTVTDASGQTTTGTVTVVVGPMAMADTATATAGTALDVAASDGVLANDRGTGLTATVDRAPANGTVVLGKDGSYTYTPAPGSSGTDTFTYTATDRSGATSTGLVTVTVRPSAQDDTLSVPAGTALAVTSGTLTANDRGTGLVVTAVTDGAHGTAVLGTDGSVTVTPADGFSGTDRFTYTARDASGATTTGTVTVTVTPVASPDERTVQAGATLTVTTRADGVLGNDSGSDLTVTGHTEPGHGVLVLGTSGTFTYTPAAGFSGTDAFTYTATDGSGAATAPTRVVITVLPSAAADSATTAADRPVGIDVQANDAGTGLTTGLQARPAHGTVAVGTDGTVEYTPAAGFSGTDTFTYTVTDRAGETTLPVTVTVTVTPVTMNDDAHVDAGATLTLPAADVLRNDSGSDLTVTAVGGTKHGTVTLGADGSLVYAPATGFSGTDWITYTVTDGSGRSTTGIVTVLVGPTVTPDRGSVTAGSTLTVSAGKGVLANDAGSDLTAALDRAPANGTVRMAADGAYTYTPADGFSGTDRFTYRATDGTGSVSTGLVTITVTPRAQDDARTTAAGTTLVLTSGALVANDSGTGLLVTGVTGGAHGTVTLGTDGAVAYAPQAGWSGTDRFTYTVTDAARSTATATVTVTVAPVAQADAGTVQAGQTLALTTRASGVLGNDSGSDLTVASHTEPDHGVLVLDPATGGYRYTPVDGFSGDDSFAYTATDPAGTPATATVRITVTPVTQDDTATTSANWPVTIDVQANDRGTGLTTTVVGRPGSGTAVVERDGRVTYTPVDGFSGTDAFTYRAVDRAGRDAGLATVTVTVRPVAMPDTVTTASGATATVPAATLLAGDLGSDLMVTGAGGTAHGTVTVGSDGAVVYTPASGFSGSDTVTYTVTDGAGQTATGTITVLVGPTATPDTVTVRAGATRTVTAADGVLANDRGTDLTAAIDAEPLHGDVELRADGSYTYTPAGGFSGTDRFTYTATDGSGSRTTGVVTVTVRPTAVDDRRTTTAGTPVTVTSAALTANDVGIGLTVTGVIGADHGTATLAADGSVTYTPEAGWSGKDSVRVTVTDAIGGTATSDLVVTVTPVVTAPATSAVADGQLVVPADQGVLDGATGTDLTVTDHTRPDHGSVDIAADGSYTYTPKPGFSGQDGFDVTVTDGAGNTTTGTVTITVAPKAVDDRATTPASTPVSVPVTANDSGTALRVGSVEQPAHGTVTTTADGAVTYAPTTGSSGTDTFRYTVVDPTGGSATATVTVTVTPTAVDDALRTDAGTALVVPGTTLTGNDLGTGLTVTGHGDARHGTVTTGADGGLVYTPTVGSSGTDRFTYTMTDTAGQEATATVTVIVGAVAVDHHGTTTTNGTMSAPAVTGVLTGGSGSGLWAQVDRESAHGTVRMAKDGSYVYTPHADWSGIDTFTYTATDAEGDTATGLVTITVTPTAGADATRTAAGRSVTVRGPGVLGNDHGTDLTVVGVDQPAHGTATIAADGTFVYTPAAGFSGVDTVPYTVQDAAGQQVHATVTVTVGITATDDSGRTIAGQRLSVDARHGLLGNDEGSGLTAGLHTKPAHGSVTVHPDGSYVYTPAAGSTGEDTFVYTVTDAAGQTTTATATITVVAGAVAQDDRATGTKDRPVTLRPLDNDTPTVGASFRPDSLHLLDPATGHMSDRFTVDGSGTWSVEDGVVVFTPQDGYHGTQQVDYTVQDTAGQIVTATITVVYPVGLAAVVHTAQLAFTGATGLVGLGLSALALLLIGAALLFRRRAAEVVGVRRR